MVVIDASVLYPTLIRAVRSRRATGDVLRSHGDLHAPDLAVAETISVCRRYRRAGLIDDDTGTMAVHALQAASITFYSQAPHALSTWELRDRCSAYDAAYVSLARTLDLPLLTADARLARAAEGTCAVRLVALGD